MSGASLATLLVSGLYLTAMVWGGVAWIAVVLGAMVLMAVLGAALSRPRLSTIGRVVEHGSLAITSFRNEVTTVFRGDSAFQLAQAPLTVYYAHYHE